LEVPGAIDDQCHDSFQAQLLARQALDEDWDSFANIIGQTRNRLESLVLENNPDDHKERSRLRDM
jgi:nitrogen-specific signal transduction histidine kinase